MKITVPIRTEIELSNSDMLEVAITYLKNKRTNEMEFIREVNGKSVWHYDDPHHRHGSIREYAFREATEEELLIYKTYQLLHNEKFQRN